MRVRALDGMRAYSARPGRVPPTIARGAPGSATGVVVEPEPVARRDRSAAHLAQAAFEEAALGVVAPERDRATVARRRLGRAAGAAEEIGARGGQQPIVGQLAARLERV